ncbi:MAG: beta-ketoacyl-[acyl-carrier-protein] synthase family protein [Nitrospira sp.]|nr:beta-ketoacyl-[acyl-carrier-protein] synthase family protein [Nitrospira sp.]MDH4243758.1 beta-ketoacyl-[acyl-carrier-protein] synthase family protein [Nitrospira sp.]MDH4356424.1 beta-ketoacyl-[acyl-carrier-protein] synthase family protein [Nitrospira sp.]MDH5318794.1 beta-ketoacyl-[acyl-carrier-protein] synthase family protein [Nitrospira sp.]
MPNVRPMAPLVLSAYTLVTANGRGVGPVLEAIRERRSGLKPCDFEDVTLKTYVGRVAGLEDFSLDHELKPFDCRNNRLAWLGLQQDGFTVAVAEARQRYGAHRIAVVMGTSTSGILETEHAYRARDPQTGQLPGRYTARYRYTHNMFSLGHFTRTCLGLQGPAMVISTACSSSAKAFATAARLMQAGLCDAAIVGGVDSLCHTTLYGFSALQLLSASPCRPCDEDRDGLSLGEAAGYALLEFGERVGGRGTVALLGYGESTDGYHMSHPHPEGAGAVHAIRDSLIRARLRPENIEYVNLHGTATPANDSVEDKAVYSIFGARPACSSTKGWTGHTLGAAGITEAVISALCLEHGVIPGTLNCLRVDPSLKSRILRENQIGPLSCVLSNIFGFGGNNCSLVLGKL